MKVQDLIDILEKLSPEEKSFDLVITSYKQQKAWNIKPIDLEADYDDGLDVDYDEKYLELVLDD